MSGRSPRSLLIRPSFAQFGQIISRELGLAGVPLHGDRRQHACARQLLDTVHMVAFDPRDIDMFEIVSDDLDAWLSVTDRSQRGKFSDW